MTGISVFRNIKQRGHIIIAWRNTQIEVLRQPVKVVVIRAKVVLVRAEGTFQHFFSCHFLFGKAELRFSQLCIGTAKVAFHQFVNTVVRQFRHLSGRRLYLVQFQRFRPFGKVEKAVCQILQIAVAGFHALLAVREEQYALIRCHSIYPFFFTRQFSVVPAFRLVMAYKLPVPAVLL